MKTSTLLSALAVGVSLVCGCHKDQPAAQQNGPLDPDRWIPPASIPQEEKLEGAADGTIPTTGKWLGFRGPGQKNSSAEEIKIPSEIKKIWKRTLTGGYSSLTIEDGLMFTLSKRGDSEIVIALDIQSGEKRWEFAYPVVYGKLFPKDSGVFSRAPSGPRSTPVIDGEHLFTIGTAGTLHCLEKKTGKKVWSQELASYPGVKIPLFGYSGSPLVWQGKVFVQTGSEQGEALLALDAATGAKAWAVESDPYSYSTAQVLEIENQTQILFFSGSGLVALDPQNGQVKWRHPWTTQENQNTATPLILGDRIFISSGYSTGGSLLQVFAEKEPEVIWKSKALSSHFHAAVVADGFAYGFTDQRLRCINLETGKIAWDKPGLGYGSVLLAGKTLVILTGRGELIFAAADSEEYREMSRTTVFETAAWTAPVLLDGILYLRDEWEVSAIDVRP